MKENKGNHGIKEWLFENVDTNLPKIKAKKKQEGISEELMDLIKDPATALKQLKLEEAEELNKEIVKQKKVKEKSKS